MDSSGRLPGPLVARFRSGVDGSVLFCCACARYACWAKPSCEASPKKKEAIVDLSGGLGALHASVPRPATTHTKIDVRSLDAVQREALNVAVQKELSQFEKYGVFERVPFESASTKPLRTRFVNTLKLIDPQTDACKYKSRLVVRGDLDDRDDMDVSVSLGCECLYSSF